MADLETDIYNSEFEEDFLSEEDKYFLEFHKEEKESEKEEIIYESDADGMTQHLWMVSFADLMTILMIFFLSLFGYAYSGITSNYEKTITMLQKNVATGKEINILEKKERETNAASQLEKFIKEKNLSEFAKVETNAQRVKISLSNPILFDSGSSDLKEEAIPALKEIAQLINTMDNPVIVEGHTDNVPMISKRFRSNFELSAARAFSVINYFISSEKMSPSRFSTFGYGEYRPISPNDTENNRAKNRRIEINIIRKT
ncbi:MAG: hypothetical protein A2474_02065, partial [Elusimicrobia bacterium RIFOXYC2_FULL_34_12]